MNKIVDAENKELIELFEKIQYCENVEKYYNGEETNCDEIIKSQGEKEENFQLPEPWNGDITNAPILIISFSPSIDKEELYPTKEWEKEKRIDFYFNRFQNKWTKNEKYIKLKDGSYSKTLVRFWNEAKERGKELLEKENIILGKDIALTWVVRCKTKKAIMAEKAATNCCKKFLDKTLTLSNSKVILCAGVKVEKILREFYNLDEKTYIEDIVIAGKKRDLVFIGQTGSKNPRKLSILLNENQLERIKLKLKKLV